jgi:hypothetical protein
MKCDILDMDNGCAECRAKAIREALIAKKGWLDEDLPSSRTISTI